MHVVTKLQKIKNQFVGNKTVSGLKKKKVLRKKQGFQVAQW